MKSQDGGEFSAYPRILFRVKDSLFSISSEYVTDMLPVPDRISGPRRERGIVRGMLQSFDRVISVLDAGMLLGLCNAPSDTTGKLLLVLRQRPYKGLMVDEILSVLSPERIRPIENSSLRCDFVTGAFESEQAPDIFLEINIDRLLKRCAEQEQGQ